VLSVLPRPPAIHATLPLNLCTARDASPALNDQPVRLCCLVMLVRPRGDPDLNLGVIAVLAHASTLNADAVIRPRYASQALAGIRKTPNRGLRVTRSRAPRRTRGLVSTRRAKAAELDTAPEARV
jgi:hypothetical protein